MPNVKVLKTLLPKIWSYRNFYKGLSRLSVAAVFIVAAAVLGGVYFGALKVLEKIDGLYLISGALKGYLLSMTCFSFFSMLVLSALISSMSNFFTAKDLPLLFSMPVSHKSIFLSKFIETSFFSVSSAYLVFVTIILAFARSYGCPFWLFLVSMAAVTPFFYIMPAAIGCFFSLVISKVFPVNQARKVMYYFILILLVFLVVLFRALEPEKLISADKFESLANYLLTLNSPAFEKFPSSWISNSLTGFLKNSFDGAFWTYFGLSYAAAAVSFAACFYAGHRLYRECYLKYQEEQDLRPEAAGGFLRIVTGPVIYIVKLLYGLLLKILPRDIGTVLDKDVKTFTRTQVLVVQSFMMIAITAFYLYNVTLLPAASQSLPADIVDMFGFFNIGMVAFIISSYAIRFVFPVFSLEGKAFYIIKTSPIDIKKYLRLKFYSNFIPMVFFALVLCVVSNNIMSIRRTLYIVSVIDTVVLTYFICRINLYLGIVFPVLDASVSEIPASFGGFITMIACVAYISVLLLFEAVIAYFEFFSRFGVSFNYWEYLLLIISSALIVVSTVISYYYPRRLADEKMVNFYEEVRV